MHVVAYNDYACEYVSRWGRLDLEVAGDVRDS